MIKKEILATLRQTAMTLSFSLLLPVVYWINEQRLVENKPFGHYAEFGAMTLLMFLVLNLAYTMFAPEDKDGASEYLKSLPIPKFKLLCMKILPRLLVSLFFIFGYLFIVSPLAGGFTIGEYFVVFIPVLVVILSGFLLGISDRRNPFLAGLLLLPAFYWILSGPLAASIAGGILMKHTNFIYEITGSSIALMRFCFYASQLTMNLIPTLLPVAVLLPLYRKWDCSSGKLRSQVMLKKLLLPITLMLVITFVTFNIPVDWLKK
jgi:hypothetical protein